MIGGALGRKMAAGHLSRRSPPLLRRMGRRAALVDQVVPGAGSSTWLPPPLLRRSPWTEAFVDKVVPGAGSSTASPSAEYASQAVARTPPPAAAGVGLQPAGNLSPDADSSKAVPVPLSPPATAGVGFQGTDPTSSMAVPPARPAAVGVGLRPVGHLSSMDVQVPPPPPDVAVGVGFRGIYLDPDTDSSQAVPLPPPATTGFALQGPDPTSSVAALPAAVGVGLLAVGHHSQRPLVSLTLFRSPRTPLEEMVVPGPGSPPQYGSPDVSSQPLPASAGIDMTINELNSSMRFQLPVSHPRPPFIQENGLRGFRRSPPQYLCKVSRTMTAVCCGDLHNSIIARLTKNKLSPTRAPINRLQSRSYCKETRIPFIPFDETLPPPPPPPPSDLTSAPQFDPASSPSEKMISQEIRAVSYASELVFDVMEKDIDLAANKFLDVNALKTMFEEYKLEEALEIRGLLWPHPLEDNPRTRFLHFEHDQIFGSLQKVIHLSTWRLMEILIGMPREYWRPLLDFLSSQRTIIHLDWKVELTTWVSFALYDFGVECAPDDVPWYKSESDASFDKESEKKKKLQGEEEGKADIGVLIWKGRKVVWCEVYKQVPCRSSMSAEATGMYLQLKRAIGLKYLKVHTDNNTIRKVVAGKLITSKIEEENKLYKLLRVMTGYFCRVAPRWVPREEVKFVDGLLRNPKVMNQVGLFERGMFLTRSVVNGWKPHLRGDPIFTILPGKGFCPGTYRLDYKFDFEDTCFLAVKEKGKIDGIYHLIHALYPADVYIITNKAQANELFDEVNKLSDLFQVPLSREEGTCCTTFKMRWTPRFRDSDNTRDLIIVLDSSLPKELYSRKETFTVFLVTESEKQNFGGEIPKFSPLSFVSFHQFISKSLVESS